MKSISAVLASIIAVAAADSYGYGAYGAPSSSSKLGYTTVYPGYGHEPVTVTSQYQAVPTYVSGELSEYLYVSTVIKGYNGKSTTITKTNQAVTLYSTQSTITHYKTEPAQGYAAPTGSYSSGGGYYPPKNGSAYPVVKEYYELYEKIHEAKYKDLGPKALPGYAGSELYKGSKDKQRVHVKEYSNGKWSTWIHVFDYGLPKPSATTFEKPGVYTVPAYDKTVTETYTAAVEAKITAAPHVPVTYGGYTITVTKPTTITTSYPAHLATHGTKTVTVYKTKVVTCTSGKNEVEKATTVTFDKETTFAYPTVTVYPPGVYHHSKETVTVTKSNQAYTCGYQSTGKLTDSYPTVTSTKSYDSYPTESATETYPTGGSPDYGNYPEETPSGTSPHYPDPSSDHEEPEENYGTPYAGYVKRGGLLERRKAEPQVKRASNKRVILV